MYSNILCKKQNKTKKQNNGLNMSLGSHLDFTTILNIHTLCLFIFLNKTATMNIWSNILQANKQTLTSDVFIDWA